MIKITYKNPPEQFTFGMVEHNQFFINNAGQLCQKRSSESCSIIADATGVPMSSWQTDLHFDIPIQKVIPQIERIEFE